MIDYLASHGFSTYTLDSVRVTERYGSALTAQDQIDLDALIAAYVEPVPDLTRRQFLRFYQLSGLKAFINTNLPALEMSDPELHADVVSQLEGGTVYYWAVAEYFMTQLLQIFPNPPAVDFDALRQLWIAQAAHHVQI